MITKVSREEFLTGEHCSACSAEHAPFKSANGHAYCEEHKQYAAEVMRWVLTYVKRTPYKTNDGSDAVWDERRLMEFQQGRYTYETEERAQARLNAITSNNAEWRINETWGKKPDFKVVECPCYLVHFDPKQCVFDA
jgi:hypothetical protein